MVEAIPGLARIQRKERFWTGVELAVPLLMLLTAPFFEDAETHEFVLGVFEGFAVWRKNQLANKAKALSTGLSTNSRRIQTNYTTLLPHLQQHLEGRSARKKSQLQPAS